MNRVLVRLQSRSYSETQYEAKEIMITLILWLVWKSHPGAVICAAFWLSMIWVIHSKRLIRSPAGSIVLLGVVLNALVTELNGGVMPVVGMPMHFRPASPIWQTAQASNHLLLLADQAALHFFSIGDLALIGGTLIFIVAKLSQTLAKQSLWRARHVCSRGD